MLIIWSPSAIVRPNYQQSSAIVRPNYQQSSPYYVHEQCSPDLSKNQLFRDHNVRPRKVNFVSLVSCSQGANHYLKKLDVPLIVFY